MIKKTAETWEALFGGVIRRYRNNSGLTQQQAATKYGCSLRWWQHLEQGKNISIKTLLLVSKILMVKPWLLLKW